ncbi:MAG: M12 family metallo-peptidase [Bacteroidota bacterium]
MKKFTRFLTLSLPLIFGITSYAQSIITPVETMVMKSAAEHQSQQVNLFTVDPATAQKSIALTGDLRAKTILSLDEKLSGQLLAKAPEVLEMAIPSGGNVLNLQLVKQEITTFDFSVVTDKSNGKPIAYTQGVHYRGIVKGQPNSVASMSVFGNEVMALISTEEGNFNLGKVGGMGSTYVLYNERDLSGKKVSACETPEMPAGFVIKESNTSHEKAAVKCVKVYIETDYDLFQNKGNSTNVSNYITGLFNQVATLYQNEGITTQISQIYVWTSNDPYSGSSSSAYLNAFKSTRTTYNGDIAHLVNITGNLGGVAYVDVICNKTYGYAFSCIDPSYNNVPTYSWAVEVFTHEMGHNLGSPHTQSCSWSGGALDNCYTTEGGCAAGPAPTNGGTIMSYCHLTNYGINFNNGFGTQPGNLIRSKVSAATCLGTCETGGPATCNVPGSVGASAVSQSGFTITWTGSASAYDVRYKAASSSTWTTTTSTTTSKVITGLAASTAYQFEVRSNCGSGTVSAYSATGSVTTSAVPASYCASKGNSVSGEWIANVTLGSINNTTTGNAGYGNFTSMSTSAAAGSSVSFTLKPGFPKGGFLGLMTLTQPEFWAVWVDFNRDGDFNDAGERVYGSTASSTGNITGTFVVPAGTTAGATRVRVAMKRSSIAGPCETFANGEVEDYTLVITAGTGKSKVKTAPIVSAPVTQVLKTNVYPNPSSGIATLDLQIPVQSGEVKLQVTDLTGKIIQSASWSNSTDEISVNHQLDLSTQPKGIYLVHVSGASVKPTVMKLVVQ